MRVSGCCCFLTLWCDCQFWVVHRAAQVDSCAAGGAFLFGFSDGFWRLAGHVWVGGARSTQFTRYICICICVCVLRSMYVSLFLFLFLLLCVCYHCRWWIKVVINSSQGSITARFWSSRIWWSLYCKFTAESMMKGLWKSVNRYRSYYWIYRLFGCIKGYT